MNSSRSIPASNPRNVLFSTILINGEELPTSIHVLHIDVSKRLNKITSCTLMIKDGQPAEETFEYSDGDYFIPGAEIEIKADYQEDGITLFKGIITKHSIRIKASGKSYLEVECKDKAVSMTLAPKWKTYTEITETDLFSELIAPYDVAEEQLI